MIILLFMVKNLNQFKGFFVLKIKLNDKMLRILVENFVIQ